MDDPTPDSLPMQRPQSGARPDSARCSISSRIVGVFAVIWAVVAWVEWFLIPILYPASGGPVPHLAFAPQVILLLLGCVAVVLIIPAWAIGTRCWWMLIYAVPAAAYVVFQVWRDLM